MAEQINVYFTILLVGGSHVTLVFEEKHALEMIQEWVNFKQGKESAWYADGVTAGANFAVDVSQIQAMYAHPISGLANEKLAAAQTKLAEAIERQVRHGEEWKDEE